MYGDRSNQLQLRVAKILRFGGNPRDGQRRHLQSCSTRTRCCTSAQRLRTWQRPESILNPRWAKIVLQYRFLTRDGLQPRRHDEHGTIS